MESDLNYCNFTLVGTGGPAPWAGRSPTDEFSNRK
nr:MAG TPA: hypothetical protein [Caudoviricetes sp.]